MTMHVPPRRPTPDVAQTSIDIRRRPSTPTPIVVVGAGGHGRELADIVRSIEQDSGEVHLTGLCDDGEADRLVLARSGMRFLGNRTSLEDLDVDVHLGLGYPRVRRQVDAALGVRAARPLIHPSAIIGSGVTMADGVVIAQLAVLTTNVRLGRHSHVNVSATVSHDCIIGDYVTICPGATITGSAIIGDAAFVGAGATILPGVHVGAGATIGAGAVVTKDVPVGQTLAGIPAAPL